MKPISRRNFMASGAAAILAGGITARGAEQPKQAQIAITLDLEMARNFPKWEDTHWDYEKGNLNDDAKNYAVAAARRVKSHGGRIHFFVVGRVFEQENVDWLKEIAAEGHPIGNHTYDHVFVLAQKPEDIQYRFARAPWLIEGKTPAEVIRENIQLTNAAMKARLGITPAGFRTPGGFADGLNGREDVQRMMLELGFDWVSCKYPAHPYGEVGKIPGDETLQAIVAAQEAAQPFAYPTGLIDVPMNPISDIGAYRNGRWPLDSFLKSIEMSVRSVIEKGKVFDFLAHQSVTG
ncbi:polysaccharide deacetylase family protein, partial [Candidatus Sumerlaeota bacterium]|nr:polysaccharide deacetylase family protein [Candidatus Sumerlaeota bacterium]